MKKGIWILLGILLLVCLLFAGYLIADEIRLQRAYRNYPVAYTGLIQQYAAQYELDPYLVTAVMRCESSFDTAAVSPVGAIGLMQVMPDTGTWIAHKLDLDDVYTESMLQEPEVSLEFGCWYLRFLSGRFDGRTMEMLAGYNAGHGTVERWLKNPDYTENGALIRIPVDDVRAYYQKVVTAYEAYRTLYPELYGE